MGILRPEQRPMVFAWSVLKEGAKCAQKRVAGAFWLPGNSMLMVDGRSSFTPNGVSYQSPGSRSAPWVSASIDVMPQRGFIVSSVDPEIAQFRDDCHLASCDGTPLGNAVNDFLTGKQGLSRFGVPLLDRLRQAVSSGLSIRIRRHCFSEDSEAVARFFGLACKNRSRRCPLGFTLLDVQVPGCARRARDPGLRDETPVGVLRNSHRNQLRIQHDILGKRCLSRCEQIGHGPSPYFFR